MQNIHSAAQTLDGGLKNATADVQVCRAMPYTIYTTKTTLDYIETRRSTLRS